MWGGHSVRFILNSEQNATVAQFAPQKNNQQT
jgi:hypothetical protein